MDVIAQLSLERDRASQAAAEKTMRLQELMLEYVSAIATETATAARLDQMIATLRQGVAFPLRPEQPGDRVKAEEPADQVEAQSRSVDREVDRPRRLQIPHAVGTVARVILEELAIAGEKGLSGREVNEAVTLAGFTLDASEKNKTRLKKKNLVRHDAKNQHWYSIAQTKHPEP